ncbi:hypothetical protein AVEN_6240-1 [Araneus ventricosus]|uniref:Uncharacterized protein n=1 Tax=Araneus ventricosus TaxID=182803 RepID=A0A4Y2GMP5_ARAVE|nr:hypothetical protein AVEN_6240-1 [Araneus ventricosus]
MENLPIFVAFWVTAGSIFFIHAEGNDKFLSSIRESLGEAIPTGSGNSSYVFLKKNFKTRENSLQGPNAEIPERTGVQMVVDPLSCLSTGPLAITNFGSGQCRQFMRERYIRADSSSEIYALLLFLAEK